jgi:O-methyltransferase
LQLKGDIVECGTFHGLSAFQIGKIIKEKSIDKSFHIFDSFEGLSVLNKDDDIGKTKNQDEELRKQFAYGENLVRQNLKDYNFINYYKGWIPDRFNEVQDKSFSFVHIDVDLYQPIKDSIEFFYPRLADRGIMVFDDYGYTAQFPGAKKAIDELIEELRPTFFLTLPSGQAFLIK